MAFFNMAVGRLSFLALISTTLATIVPSPVLALKPRDGCGDNSATNRACWLNDYNISTDYDTTYPSTGTTRTYEFNITNVTSWAGPDGVTKLAMLINDQYPGPTLEANWGDMIEVTINNQLQDNGTTIHWHGIHQQGTNIQDGVNGVTECPCPPGHSKTYTFQATQYGTSWYHSHFSAQYGNGVAGPIVISGPASADYDIDLGPYVISDYYHDTADNLLLLAENPNLGPPSSDNILFRGKNINPSGSGGEYDTVTLTPNKKHLLRLINTSVDNSITVSLNSHNFTVIATDFVPVTPIVKDQLFIAIGQRYDVIIEADQDVDNYWFNVTLEIGNLCGASLNPYPASIFQYDGAEDGNPTDPGTTITAGCMDETGFSPIVERTASSSEFTANSAELNITLAEPVVNSLGTVFRWLVNEQDIEIEWDHPILQYVNEGNDTWPAKANVIEVSEDNQWTFWIVQNQFVLPHPLHLHGHDFLVLGTGDGSFDVSTNTDDLVFDNPVRRDVAQIPGSGWIVIAFETNNPGAWLMHCHIAWHISQGLGVQFLERKDDIAGLMDLDDLNANCDAWKTYETSGYWLPDLDSGL